MQHPTRMLQPLCIKTQIQANRRKNDCEFKNRGHSPLKHF